MRFISENIEILGMVFVIIVAPLFIVFFYGMRNFFSRFGKGNEDVQIAPVVQSRPLCPNCSKDLSKILDRASMAGSDNARITCDCGERSSWDVSSRPYQINF